MKPSEIQDLSLEIGHTLRQMVGHGCLNVFVRPAQESGRCSRLLYMSKLPIPVWVRSGGTWKDRASRGRMDINGRVRVFRVRGGVKRLTGAHQGIQCKQAQSPC